MRSCRRTAYRRLFAHYREIKWSCRESNPGPPTPKQGFYERSPQLLLRRSSDLRTAVRRLAQGSVPPFASSVLRAASLLMTSDPGPQTGSRATTLLN